MSDPSLDAVGPACPQCGSTATRPKGASGATGRALLGGGVLDALGVVSHDLRLRFICQDCSHTFHAEEGGWDAGSLAEPCTIDLHRAKSMLGAMMPLLVNLNGEQVGTVANGASLQFQTMARHNVLVIADHNGASLDGMSQSFEAEDGGKASFRFEKRRLIRV